MAKELIYRVKKVYHFFKTWLFGALPANLYYGFPSRKLKVIAITGTDGKTTTSTMTYQVLKSADKRVGLISTVAAYIGDRQVDTGFHVTTPGPWALQKFLAEFVKQDFEYVVIETTSHGIYQFRTWGIKPYIAGLTNITQNEALDYHLTYQHYLDTKVQKLKQADSIFINKDDASYAFIKQKLPAHKTQAYSALAEMSTKVVATITEKFHETYNHANATLVYKIAEKVGISDDDFCEAIRNFQTVPGRMQHVENEKGLTIIVDFAHTPNALHQALVSLRQNLPPGKKLITIVGCAGLRDPRKRGPMGQWAAELSDLAIFTSEDPRTEDVWTIIRQMKEQLTSHHDRIISIPDREQAIEFALTQLAQKGDTIGIFGKGHEHSMAFDTTEYPWNDVTAVTSILQKHI
jgi:UDP-N-acetylmuramoyl-L-alanyl-D-glutamate--2,6-diaminopimelate ligase